MEESNEDNKQDPRVLEVLETLWQRNDLGEDEAAELGLEAQRWARLRPDR